MTRQERLFDKVARAIGLGYPGSPKIDKLSREGNQDAIAFPRAKIEGSPYDFSFSGVKSAVLNYLNHAKMTGEEVNRADLAASFQKAVVDVLVEHAMQAAEDHHIRKIAIAGVLRPIRGSKRHGEGVRRKRAMNFTVHPLFLYGQCGHDRCGGILRIQKGAVTAGI